MVSSFGPKYQRKKLTNFCPRIWKVANFWYSVLTSVKVESKNYFVLLIFLLKSTPCWLTSEKLHDWGHSMENGNKLKRIIGTHGNWKKAKFWGPFWIYQLNSTFNSAYSLQKWAKWAELAVLFSWQLQNGPHDFDFFNCHGCRLFIGAYFFYPSNALSFHA